MLSCVYDGKVLDFHWKKISKGDYRFFIGDILIGRVMRDTCGTWSAFGEAHSTRAPLVNGFKNRYYCAEYLLKHQGYWKY